MLKIVDIHTYYGDSYVIQGVSLEVEKGMVLAMLGRNGVGKTTLIRSIVGFTPARIGERSSSTVRTSPAWIPYHIIQLGIGLVPQGRRVFPSLTVRENLAIAERCADASGVGFCQDLHPLPPSRRASRPAGQYPERRGTADAGDCPGPDFESAVHR